MLSWIRVSSIVLAGVIFYSLQLFVELYFSQGVCACVESGFPEFNICTARRKKRSVYISSIAIVVAATAIVLLKNECSQREIFFCKRNKTRQTVQCLFNAFRNNNNNSNNTNSYKININKNNKPEKTHTWSEMTHFCVDDDEQKKNVFTSRKYRVRFVLFFKNMEKR